MRRKPVNSTEKYLFDHRHWRIEPPADLAKFFHALPALVPKGARVALAGGVVSPKVQAFLASAADDPGDLARERLAQEFIASACLPLSESKMASMATLANSHAEPEIAIHIAAFTTAGPFLE
jgi:hypothetical protein